LSIQAEDTAILHSVRRSLPVLRRNSNAIAVGTVQFNSCIKINLDEFFVIKLANRAFCVLFGKKLGSNDYGMSILSLLEKRFLQGVLRFVSTQATGKRETVSDRTLRHLRDLSLLPDNM
jgi:hypothetical protein